MSQKRRRQYNCTQFFLRSDVFILVVVSTQNISSVFCSILRRFLLKFCCDGGRGGERRTRAARAAAA